MAIAYVGAAKASPAANPTGAQTWPLHASAAADNVAIGVAYSRASTKAFTSEGAGSETASTLGVDLVVENSLNSSYGHLLVVAKVLTSTDVANGYFGTMTLNSVSNGTTGWQTMTFSGVDKTSPIDAEATIATGTSTTPNCPSVSVGTTGSAVVGIWGALQETTNNTQTDFSAPSTYTEDDNAAWTTTAGSDASSQMFYKLNCSSGANDPGTSTTIVSAGWYAHTISLEVDSTTPRSGTATGSAALKKAFTNSTVTGSAALLKAFTNSTATGSAALLKAFTNSTATGSAKLVETTGMDIVVPIEMLDYPVQAPSDSSTVTWARSEEHLNPSNYDGATYYFEITASGNSAFTWTLWDNTNSSALATITTDTTSRKRYRSTSFTPNTGDCALFLKSEGTTDTDTRCWGARIIVVQAAATKTRIPVTHMANGPLGTAVSANDYTSGYCAQTSNTSYQTMTSNGSYWKYTAADWATVTDVTWEVLAACSGASTQGDISLYTGDGTPTEVASLSFDETDTTITRQTATGCTLEDTKGYYLRLRGDGTYNTRLFKSRIYFTLNTATKAEVYWKIGGYTTSIAADGNYDYHRFKVDKAQYSGTPKVYLEFSGYANESYDYHIYAATYGSGESGGTATAITGSGTNLNTTTSKTRFRSADWASNYTSNDLLGVLWDYNAATIAFLGGAVVVTAEGGAPPKTGSATGSANLKKALTGTATGSAALKKALTGTADGSASLKKAYTSATTTGSASLKKAYTSATTTGSALLKKARTGTATGSAYLILSRTGTATGSASLKKARTGTATGSAFLKLVRSATATGSAALKKALTGTATGAAVLKKAYTGTATGSAGLKKAIAGTATGSADLKKALTGSATGSAYLTTTKTGTATGSAALKKALSGTATGSAFLVNARTGTATGSAALKKALTGTAQGAAVLKKAYSGTATGSANLKKALSAVATGSASLKKAYSGTATGSASLKKAFTGTATGSAFLNLARTATATGSAALKKAFTGTATGSAYLVSGKIGSAQSSADLKKALTGTAQGSAWLVNARTGTATGSAALKQARAGTATGSAALKQWRVSGLLTNHMTNPSFEVDTNADGLSDGYTLYTSGLGGSVTQSRPAGRLSGYSQRLQYTGTSDAGEMISFAPTTPGFPGFAEGEVVTLTMYVKGTVSGVTVRLLIDAYNSSNNYIAGSSPTTVTLTTGWQLVTNSYTLPAGTVKVDPVLRVTGIDTGDTIDLYTDDWLLTKLSVVYPYFDGATTDTADWTYDWTGTANASTSTALAATAARSSASLKKALTGTAQGSAFLKLARTGTAQGSAFLKLARTASATGAAALKKAFTATATGSAALKKALTATATGSAALKKARSATATGAAKLILQRTGTATGSANLKKALTGTAQGSAYLTSTRIGTAQGAADLKKSLTASATGAASLKKAYTSTATGSASLKKSYTGSVTGSAALLAQRTSSATGTAALKQARTVTATSSANLKQSLTGAATGSALIVTYTIRTGTATGSAMLFGAEFEFTCGAPVAGWRAAIITAEHGWLIGQPATGWKYRKPR